MSTEAGTFLTTYAKLATETSGTISTEQSATSGDPTVTEPNSISSLTATRTVDSATSFASGMSSVTLSGIGFGIGVGLDLLAVAGIVLAVWLIKPSLRWMCGYISGGSHPSTTPVRELDWQSIARQELEPRILPAARTRTAPAELSTSRCSYVQSDRI